MIFVTGGLYQGKLDYVLKTYNLDIDDVSDFMESQNYDFSKRILRNFHKYIEYCINNSIDIDGIISTLDDKIVISCEVGCGVVPIDKNDRYIRECIGRINCILAEKSENVIKVCCGIGMTIR